ncbi:MAG: ATP-binding protein [Acidobacteriota bacterium]
MADILVGTVKGPGEKPNEFIFVTTDNDQTRISEFVYYETRAGQKIIGTVTDRNLSRALPDSFLADPATPPAAIAAMIGIEDSDLELYEITVSLIGYFDEQIRDFINPRIPPMPGQSVYLASSEMLARVLSPRQQGETGAAHLGSLLTREKDAVPVVLSVKDLVSTHLAILASTGAGKSYTAGVLIEELMRPENASSVLIVDPHGEYDNLQEIKKAELKNLFSTSAYEPEVKIFKPERVKVRFDSLEFNDIVYLLPEVTEKMRHLLGVAFRAVKERVGKHGHYGYQDLADEVTRLKYDDEKGDNMGAQTTVEALLWRLDARFRGYSKHQIFDDVRHNSLDELFKPGQCTVLQLVDIDQNEQQVIVATLLRRALIARMATHKGEVASATDEKYLPYPIFVLLEEAHRFAPAGQTVVSTNVLKQILSEGRKFGVGIGLITQRPGKLDSDVLSQCMTQFIMRIVNPIDQDTIAKTVEGAGRRMLDELPALTKGQVIVSGVAVNTPLMCRVRVRLTTHGGETIDAPAEWAKYHSNESRARRSEERSILVKPQPKSGGNYGGIEI